MRKRESLSLNHGHFSGIDGEFVWYPEHSPSGPVVILVNLRDQLTYVYHNGIRVGISKESSGKKGFETPTGVFTILEKHEEHRQLSEG